VGGALGAGVEVAEPTAPHGGGLAVESAGHDVTTFVGHEVLSYTGTGVSPPSPPVGLEEIVYFQRAGSGVLP
jgi:hypothetical protein